MIRVFLFNLIIVIANSCGQGKKLINTPPPSAEQSVPQAVEVIETKKAEMTWDFDHVDFGMVTKGDKRDTTYTFTNTGNEDIVIELVTACECTTYTYPDEPIKPGENGALNIVFDSSEKEIGETITIDLILKNTNPKNGYPLVYQVTYDFDIIKP